MLDTSTKTKSKQWIHIFKLCKYLIKNKQRQKIIRRCKSKFHTFNYSAIKLCRWVALKLNLIFNRPVVLFVSKCRDSLKFLCMLVHRSGFACRFNFSFVIDSIASENLNQFKFIADSSSENILKLKCKPNQITTKLLLDSNRQVIKWRIIGFNQHNSAECSRLCIHK